MTPTGLPGGTVTLTVNRKQAGKWRLVKACRVNLCQRRLQLEIQAHQEGQLPHQGRDGRDGRQHGRHDQVADVQGEVTSGKPGNPGRKEGTPVSSSLAGVLSFPTRVSATRSECRRNADETHTHGR